MALKIVEDALTFDDVLLVPAYSEVLPKDVDLTTQLTASITLKTPILSAAMDTVTEAPLAIAMAELGGIGIIHKNMTPVQQAKQVAQVKKHENGVVRDPITVTPETTLGRLLEISDQYRISGMPVVVGKQLVGIITSRDVRFEKDLNQSVANLMTPQERLITIKEGASRDEIMALFRQHRLEKVLLVNDAFELRGLVTVKDIMKAKLNPLATKDAHERLCVGAAIGAGDKDKVRAEALIDAGVDALVVDTAHGFSKGVVEQVKWLRANYQDLQIIAGNIATADAALALAKAGANCVKVGMGPGSICITRIVAGIGVPQISAVHNVANALAKTDVKLIADGGIRFSGDICKAIAAGAHTVMLGSLLAGTEESPGDVVLFQGRSYKEYRGMGSLPSMSMGSSDRYFQEDKSDQGKFVPEGIEGRVPYKGKVAQVVHQLVGGLRAGMGYTGSKDINAMRLQTEFVKVTPAGMSESHAHDVAITKEAPNYRSN